MGDSTETLQQELSQFDFVRFTFPDIHGISRNIITAQRNVPEFLEDGFYIVNVFDLIGPSSQVRLYGELVKRDSRNGWCKPRVGTAHAVPWAGNERKVGEVLCQMHFADRQAYGGCSVLVAEKQVKRLNEKGYRLLSGFEVEFALLNKENKPASEGRHFFSTEVQSGIEDFFFSLDMQLATAGVEIERMHCETGPGQVEFSLKPQWGIAAADHYFIAKVASKEIAVSQGYKASFLSKLSELIACNGSHLTSSLWNDIGENVFSDKNSKNSLSETAHHWIAGLCLHAPAISAICAPTVNCYRRFCNRHTPSHAAWGIGDRRSAFRARMYGKLGPSVENCLPSSAANPYLVLAATIAAGLDGIERKLHCPSETMDGTAAVDLPKTLSEALVALKEDDILVKAIGPFIVERFIKMKEAEVKEFPNFEPTNYDPDMLAKEIEEYKLI